MCIYIYDVCVCVYIYIEFLCESISKYFISKKSNVSLLRFQKRDDY